MKIDIELLEECSELSRYEKDLIKRVDVQGETQRLVAKLYKKTPSTICSQLKKARKKFQEWKTEHESPFEANLDKYVFGRLNRGDAPWTIIADVGHADEVMELSEKWQALHASDYWAARNFLDNYGLMSGFEEEEKPLAEAVKSVVYWLDEEQQDLNTKHDENQNLRHRLEEATNKLKTTSNKLDAAKAEIAKLERLRKYEELSEEQRRKLQSKVDFLKIEITDLEGKVEQVKAFKTALELEVDMIKQVKADLERDIQGIVLEYLGNLQSIDVLRLHNKAIMTKIQKTIAAQWSILGN